MRHVAQRQQNDCAVAAVAMAGGWSYGRTREAWREMTGKRGLGVGLFPSQVARLLSRVVGTEVRLERGRGRTVEEWGGGQAVLVVGGCEWRGRFDPSHHCLAVSGDGKRIGDPLDKRIKPIRSCLCKEYEIQVALLF